MPYTLNEKQQMFIDAYRQRIGLKGDFADEVVVNRAINALAALEAETRDTELGTTVEQLDRSIDTWCKRHNVTRNGSYLIEEKDGWSMEDEFCFADSGSDVFPDLYSDFQEFMKAYDSSTSLCGYRHDTMDSEMAGKYACQPPKFGRLVAPQAAKAAFLKKGTFGLSLALSVSSGVAMSHLVTEVRGWATVQGRTQIMTNTTCNQPAANQAQLTEENLRHFSGDDIRYSHALNRKTIYTPGVQFVAEAGGAYWLIDAIASYYGTPAMERAIASDASAVCSN